MRARIQCSLTSSAKLRRANGTIPWTTGPTVRTLASSSPRPSGQATASRGNDDEDKEVGENGSALSRRLKEMTDEVIDSGGRSAVKNVEAAGFSGELKKQLEERIAQGSNRSQHRQAFAEVEMSSSAGKGSRHHALAEPWTGSESFHDSALRMLDDSHPRLRGHVPTAHTPVVPRVGPRPEKAPTSTGQRLATARDKTSIYAATSSSEMTDEERAQMRKELKERFAPGARPMPTTLQGLTSLANERIEDAISRGKFKHIARGKGQNVQRDHNASSPFLDTTEYFMNRIIRKQEMVPPWIEKQQELVKNVASFRGRLRNDWKRHAARSIASKGGPLESQIQRAEEYALAEKRINTIGRGASDTVETKSEAQNEADHFSRIDNQGNLHTVPEIEAKSGSDPDPDPDPPASSSSPPPPPPTLSSTTTTTSPPPTSTPTPTNPFRDPTWESTERTYHLHAITTLNNLTRSYNLQAPQLAQKPYYSLARELGRCYADVAPHLADEIRTRALGGGSGGSNRNRYGSAAAAATDGPNRKVGLGFGWKGVITGRRGGGGGGGGGGGETRIRDEDLSVKGYGFRQFWRDWFG